MAIQGQSQRVNGTTQTTTYGPFGFDRIDVGGTDYDFGISKLAFGALSSITYVSAADPLPVTISGVATAALQTTANGILTTIDTDTGAIAASAASIDGKITACNTGAVVVSSSALPSGAATESTLGTLSAKFASGTVIGDVNLGATDNAVLDAIAASVAAGATLSEQQTQTTSLGRIAGKYLDFDSGGGTDSVVAVGLLLPGSGGAVIGGTAANPFNVAGTVDLGATDNAVLDAIAASIASVDGKVTAANTGAVTISSALPAGANTIGAVNLAQYTPVTGRLPVDGSGVTQPVSGTFWQATQPVSGTIDLGATDNAVLDAIAASANVMDDWDESDRAKVNPIVGQAGVQGGSGTVSANTQRVVLATDVALPTGTNSIGQVTANAGTNLNTSALALESGGNLAAAATSLALIDDAIVTVETLLSPDKVVAVAAYNENNSVYKPLRSDDNGHVFIAAANLIGVTAYGGTAHDSALSDLPISIAGYASAAAPTSVSADGDATYVWCLRNGSPVVNLAVGGTLVTGSAGLPVEGNIVDDAAFTPGTTRVLMAGFQADEASIDSVNEGDGGAARMTLDRKVIVTPQPHTAGGLSIFRSLDLDETEEEVKSSAGQIYGGFVTNTSTGTRWIKFYNATAANVTVGSTTPVITWGIQGGATDDVAAVLNLGGMGIEFTTAITVAATTGVADADTGAPGANDVIINLFYK